MQKIDRENGCLFVQPGTHKGKLIKHTYPNDGIVNKASVYAITVAADARMSCVLIVPRY